jgi:hypothetical protein
MKRRGLSSPDQGDALCFVGDTLVRTTRGPVPIRDVQVGDIIVTPFGDSPVMKKWESVTESLTTVDFSNGVSLSGKGEHKMFVWGACPTRLDALSLTNEMESFSQWRVALWKMTSLFTGARTTGFRVAVDTTTAVDRMTLSAFCTAASGMTITERFRQIITSTMSMVTGETMQSKTLSAYTDQTIRLTTDASTTNNTPKRSTSGWKWRESPLPNGTDRKKGESGTLNTERQHGLVGEQPLAPVRYAVNLTSPTSPHDHSSARCLVRSESHTAGILRLSGFVNGVAQSLWRIVTGRRNVVPVTVQTKSVEPIVVYNLTLKEHNVYYANDILAFNCLTFAEKVARTDSHMMRSRARLVGRVADADYDVFST